MKDAKGHGSNERGGRLAKPMPGHAFHSKTNAELRYIIKDASDAARSTRGMSAFNPNSGKREDTEGKYLDQVNDATTILGYRDRGGKSDAPSDVLASGPKSAPVPVHDSMIDDWNQRAISGLEARTGKGVSPNSQIAFVTRGKK